MHHKLIKSLNMKFWIKCYSIKHHILEYERNIQKLFLQNTKNMNSLHLNVIVLNLRNMPYAYIISNLAFKFNDANFFEGFHKTVSLQLEYCKIYISVYYFKLFLYFWTPNKTSLQKL